MPRTKSLATLIQHYGSERVFKPKANKIPAIYKILNREIFNNRLKTPYVKIRRIRGALGLFEFNPMLQSTAIELLFIINLRISGIC